MILVKAPYRVSFFGGGTDIKDWYKENGGSIISTTIDKYCYTTLKKRSPFFDHKIRAIYSIVESVDKVSELKHPLIKKVLEYYNFDKPLEIHHQAELPSRAGLGSSSAFGVSLVEAITRLGGQKLSKKEIAKSVINIEREQLGEYGGIQDQIASTYGGINYIKIRNNGDFIVKNLLSNFNNDDVLNFFSHMCIFYSGVQRYSYEISRKADLFKSQNYKKMTNLQSLVDDGYNFFLKKDWKSFGLLLDETWKIKKSLGNEISNTLIDEIYDLSINEGALGAKLLGAGSGGFVLVFAYPNIIKKIKSKLSKFYNLDLAISKNGVKSKFI